ncbi:MAG TPA: hypothetical protein VFI65_12595 [Streptosporangiaceae bacterium]|nr:hypothetical protein [Streptosporangiaceae bacterium]
MTAVGIVLLVTGIFTRNGVVWTIGILALLVGLIAFLLGLTGHGIAGRRHYF